MMCKKIAILVSGLLACSAGYADGTNALANVGNSAFLYAGSYDMKPGVKTWASEINQFNQTAEKANTDAGSLTNLYVYASDLELPCYYENYTPGQPTGNDTINCTDPGYLTKSGNPIFGAVFSYGTPSSNAQAIVHYYQNKLSSLKNTQKPMLIGIVDGRIDDGYLQQFDQLSSTAISDLANLIANGTASEPAPQPSSQAEGICQSTALSGIQLDIEPVDVNPGDTNYHPNETPFFEDIATDLQNCKGSNSTSNPKIMSIFAFAEGLGTFTTTTSNGSTTMTVTPSPLAQQLAQDGNVYIVDSLYDLTISNQQSEPILPGQTGGSPSLDTTVPTSLSTKDPNNYQTRVQQEVNHMIALSMAVHNANTPYLPFKFAIPAAASTHEFESAYWRSPMNAQIDGAATAGANAGGTTLINFSGTNTPAQTSQLAYVIAALSAINTGLLDNPSVKSAFKGIDLWGFAPAMEWSPNPIIRGDDNGDFHQGHDYAFFYPASPSARVLNFLATNDCLNTATIGTSNYPVACTTLPSN